MCISVEKTPIKVSPLLSKKVVYKRGRPVARICRPMMVGKVGGMQIGDDTNNNLVFVAGKCVNYKLIVLRSFFTILSKNM